MMRNVKGAFIIFWLSDLSGFSMFSLVDTFMHHYYLKIYILLSVSSSVILGWKVPNEGKSSFTYTNS